MKSGQVRATLRVVAVLVTLGVVIFEVLFLLPMVANGPNFHRGLGLRYTSHLVWVPFVILYALSVIPAIAGGVVLSFAAASLGPRWTESRLRRLELGAVTGAGCAVGATLLTPTERASHFLLPAALAGAIVAAILPLARWFGAFTSDAACDEVWTHTRTDK